MIARPAKEIENTKSSASDAHELNQTCGQNTIKPLIYFKDCGNLHNCAITLGKSQQFEKNKNEHIKDAIKDKTNLPEQL